MANRLQTFRNRITGLVEVYPESMGRAFPYLEEVDADAKPLAYVPISAQAKADYLESLKGDEPEGQGEEPEEDTK